MTYDLMVHGARLAGSGEPVDIGCLDGKLVEIGASLAGSARERLHAEGLVALPGGIDPHVHFNQPGPRAGWEGFGSGSSALAAGGVTTTLEMPLSASPPTTTAEAFDLKLAAAQAAARVDFGLWGGIVPGNLEQLEPLAGRGVIGFKAFMSVTMRDYLQSRPAIAETEAIMRAIELAAATGCPLHVVHVSTGRSAVLVAQARARGVDVTCEVTAHHLGRDRRLPVDARAAADRGVRPSATYARPSRISRSEPSRRSTGRQELRQSLPFGLRCRCVGREVRFKARVINMAQSEVLESVVMF